MTPVSEEIQKNLKRLSVMEAVKVTPTIAKELLEMNDSNRPLKARTVAVYAKDMKKGDWIFQGDSIRISRSGRLLDGQHRLHAVINSGVSQVWNIQLGLDDKSFDRMDVGKVRNAADILSIEGYANSTILQGGIKLVMSYDRGNMDLKGIEKVARPTNHDVRQWLLEKDSDLMIECAARAQKLYSTSRLIAPATYCAFLYIFSRKSKEKALEFFEKFSTGEDISASRNSPIYVLRQKLINLQAARAKLPIEERYALIVKAWNFWKEGTEIKKLFRADEEKFPRAK